MSRVLWCIRWESEDTPDVGSFGALVPGVFPSLAAAKKERDWLAVTQPFQENPFSPDQVKPVRYVVFSRPLHEASLHE